MEVRPLDVAAWDELLPASRFEAFHTAPALDVLNEYTDGDYLSGIVVRYSSDTAYCVRGGVGRDSDGVSVNSRSHWRTIGDLAAAAPFESGDGYDLVGANTERPCRDKSKFGADRGPHSVAETTGPGADVLERGYQVVGS